MRRRRSTPGTDDKVFQVKAVRVEGAPDCFIVAPNAKAARLAWSRHIEIDVTQVKPADDLLAGLRALPAAERAAILRELRKGK
jgi:hypothetical protein